MTNRKLVAMGVGVAIALAASAVMAGQEQVAGKQQMQLEKQIEKRVKNDPDLKNNQIDVKVENSVVTLKGNVDTQAERSKAVSLAHVDGVVRVEDRLEVGSEGLGTALSDGVITTKVKAKLAADDRFKLNQFSVTTNNGVVVLDGTVPTEEDRQRAIDIVRSSDGVKRVADKLRVANTSGKKQ